MASADETVKIEPESGGDNKAALDSVGNTFQTDEPAMDPQEYARLVELYDSSFRIIAEGEVVKGTVLKVSETEVVVDVGTSLKGRSLSTNSVTKMGR